jgi:hypothetical protein
MPCTPPIETASKPGGGVSPEKTPSTCSTVVPSGTPSVTQIARPPDSVHGRSEYCGPTGSAAPRVRRRIARVRCAYAGGSCHRRRPRRSP